MGFAVGGEGEDRVAGQQAPGLGKIPRGDQAGRNFGGGVGPVSVGAQPEWRRLPCHLPDGIWYTLLMSTVSYLDRLLEPVTVGFTTEFARLLVGLHADDQLQAEIDVLRRKANEGTLSPTEEASYREFVEAVDVISVFQSKARRFLASHPDGNGRNHT